MRKQEALAVLTRDPTTVCPNCGQWQHIHDYRSQGGQVYIDCLNGCAVRGFAPLCKLDWT